jgi:hypothetical protein
VRTVGPDEVTGVHRLLAVVAGHGGAHAVGVLFEPAEPQAALDLYSAQGQFLAQDSLGGVLGDSGEAERYVGRNGEIDLGDPFTVDIDDLPVHLDSRIQDASEQAHGFEHLERTWLHTNGFGVLRRFQEGIDDAAVDAATGQFDGCGETDRTTACNEYLRLRRVRHALIMLPT